MPILHELYRNDIEKNNPWDDLPTRNSHKKMSQTIDGYEIRYLVRHNDLYISMWDGDICITTLSLAFIKWRNIKVYQENTIDVNIAYQGEGLAFKLYKLLILSKNISIIAHYMASHSEGAMKLWMRLAAVSGINAYGFLDSTGEMFFVKPNLQKELKIAKKSINLYDNPDSGLIITKRNSTTDLQLKDIMRRNYTLRKTPEKQDAFGNKKVKPFKESVNKLPIPATPENITKAQDFVFQKWKARAREYGHDEPVDLSKSCKASSMFAQRIFGGQIRGNIDHQYVVLNNQIIDLNTDAADVRALPPNWAHYHDRRWFGNREHKASMKSLEPRVNRWVTEFTNLLTETKDSYTPPTLHVGDALKIGKFKNRKTNITGFKTDDHNQPVVKTTKGDQKLFKPRIVKLEDELDENNKYRKRSKT